MSLAGARLWLLGWLVLVVATASLAGQSKAMVSPVDLFHRVSSRMLEDWRRMPHYTCVQDISRRYYRSDLRGAPSCHAILDKRAERKHALPLLMSDHLELEVAVADQREVHSWPGESFFGEEDQIHDLVGNGAFGSGDFAAFIGAIFGGSARIIYEGERIVDSRQLYQYSYHVSKNASRYQVESSTSPVVTGYDGSFLLDPQAEDLVHLSVRTEELPESTASCQGVHEIDYGRSEIHGMRVLIPRETDLRVILRSGDEAVTTTSYSSCRQFSTKSTLLLDADSAVANTTVEREPTSPLATAFPPGIKFKCRIVTPIDSDTPAGRSIEGVLRTAIRERDGTILAPRGAKVKARIVRLARHFSTYDHFELAVRLESVEVRGVERPLHAGLSDQPPGPLPPKAQVGYDRSDYPKEFESLTSLAAGTGKFFFVQEHLHLRDWDSEWVTQTPEPKKEVKKETRLAQDLPGANQGSGAASTTVSEKPTLKTNLEAASTPTVASVPAVPIPPEHEAPPSSTPAAKQQPPGFRLRAESNLVLVRVVVRDSQGNPVPNLSKEDFELFDKGKPQDIAQFEMVNSASESAAPAERGSGLPSSIAVSSPAHRSFLALYFDDLNTSDADLIDARDAATSYLGASVPVNEQVAIFTSTGPLTDFTNDAKQIQAALAKLHTSPRRITGGHDCPELTDFQAQQITEFQDDYTIDAWKAALAEVAARCNPAPPPIPHDAGLAIEYNLIRLQARQVLDQAQLLARSNLQQLEQVIDYLAHLPAQRTVVLVSPGFLSESEQTQVDRIINRALREQIVVSALDPKGLPLLMRETDITRSYSPTANSGVVGATHNVDFMREAAATDVMMELADGTGGKFFHNNNDLQAGFRAVSGSTTYYILAFVPGDFDGKFHKLAVKLARSKGSVQARRGYFAVKNAIENGSARSASMRSDPEGPIKDDLQQMMSSREEINDLTVALSTDVVPSSDETKELNVTVQLDLTSVPFRKEGDRNLNTVVFVTGIYDRDDKWVTGEKKQFELKLPDSELKQMQARGVGVRNAFKLKPGRYLLREVVQDTEDHHIAAVNRTVEVP